MGFAHGATLIPVAGFNLLAAHTDWRAALSLTQLVRLHKLFKETEQPPAGSPIINDTES